MIPLDLDAIEARDSVIFSGAPTTDALAAAAAWLAAHDPTKGP